nr:hypothetical protein [Tanacetum cinerariifolium]
MSAKRTTVNEFSSSMASAVICLSTGRKFNFSKYIFNSIVRNVDSSSKFYMKVEALEQDKEAQACEIIKLKQMVKKLERKNKLKVFRLRRLKKFGTAQRVESSKDTVIDDVSKQGEIIANMDADKDVTLKNVADVSKEVEVEKDAEVEKDTDGQGRSAESQAQIYKIDLEHADKVLRMQDDKPEPVYAARRRNGVVIRDLEETDTSSTIIHSKPKSKDNGKGIMVHEPKPLKKQAQIEQDEAYAREYQALKGKQQSEAQAKKNMMIYLKNMAGFKMDYFKRMSYDVIRPIFKKYFNSNVAFLEKSKERLEEEESRALKRKDECSSSNLEELKKCSWLSKGQKLEIVRVLWSADYNVHYNTDDLAGREKISINKVHSGSNAQQYSKLAFVSLTRYGSPLIVYRLKSCRENFFEPNLCYEPNSSSFDQYHSSQSSVTPQLPQRSNENIRLEMAKLIKNNRIFLNNNLFPHEEASMEVLLAKEGIFKLIQAWDKKQIDSWNLPALLLQLLNDSQTIDEMFKQRKQITNLAEQEEQADYEEMLQDREKFMQDTQIFLEKFNQEIPELMCKLFEDVRNIKEELAEYINSPSWNNHTFFYDEDEEYSIQYREYLEKFPDAVTTVLLTEEPEYSLNMGYEHLSTILETESDEVIESSAKNLLPILSEYEVTSDDESECDMPVKDDSSSVFTTFSNPLFDDNDDFTSSDDESLSNEDVPIEEFKVYSNPLFDDEEIISDEIDPHSFNVESDFVESLSNCDTLIDSSPKFDFLEEFSGAFLPTSIADEERIRREHADDSQREEIDIFIGTNELLPPSVESDDYDSEGDIHVLEELLIDDSIPIPENELSNFYHQDDPSFPRPLPEPPDIEIFFEPDSGVLTTNVVKGISEHYVLMPNILPTLPTFDPLYPVYDTLLSFSSENEDKVFKPGILSYLLVSHQGKTTSDFFKNPMMMYGGDIPLLDVPYLHFYPP